MEISGVTGALVEFTALQWIEKPRQRESIQGEGREAANAASGEAVKTGGGGGMDRERASLKTGIRNGMRTSERSRKKTREVTNGSPW